MEDHLRPVPEEKLDKKNNTTKYVLEMLLAFIIAGIATLGVYVWQQGKVDELNEGISRLEAQVADLEKQNVANPAENNDQISEQPYLNIDSLGIKIPLSNYLSDLIYQIESAPETTQLSSRKYIHFSTETISKIKSGNPSGYCDIDSGSLGGYTVYSSRQSNEGAGDSQTGELLAVVNGHYIYFHSPQFACGNTESDVNKVASLIEPLKNAVSKSTVISR